MSLDMSYTWKKDKRLLKRSDYQLCYNFGEKQFSKLFVLFVRPAEKMRVGLAVSKKCGNAVERNRIKRVLREFFRKNQNLLTNFEVVVVPKKHVRAKSLGYANVEKDLMPFILRLCPASTADDSQAQN